MQITQKTVTGSGLVVGSKRTQMIIRDYEQVVDIAYAADPKDFLALITGTGEPYEWFNSGETMEFDEGKRIG